MSMNREEAINRIENHMEVHGIGEYPHIKLKEALDMALSALRPVSREQVILCKDCRYWQGNNGGYPHPECRWGNDETPDADDYCSFAERMEAVEIRLKELEALHGEKESD